MNGIVNASHAMEENRHGQKKGMIEISTRVVLPFVEIAIKDTGCGIAAASMDKIFDPLFTTKEVGKGTGQGLTIVHDIVVEKHGGSIDIESEEGVGTTFFIRLTLQREPEPEGNY